MKLNSRPKTAKIQKNKENLYQIQTDSDADDILDKILRNQTNEMVKNEIKEEAKKMAEMVKDRKEKLKTINLYEDVNEKIYKWNDLFNPSIPITAYVRSSSLIKKDSQKEKKEEEKNNFINPITMVDLSDEEFNKYLFKPRNSNEKSCTMKFLNFPHRAGKGDTFYFSDSFNNYYKQPLEEFVKKVPLLQAKIRVDCRKISRQIKSARLQNIKERNKLSLGVKKTCESRKSDLHKKRDLPLFFQIKNMNAILKTFGYEDLRKSIENKNEKNNGRKFIFNSYNKTMITNRPLSGYYNKSNNTALSFRNILKSPSKLILNTYDENDPSLRVFKKMNFGLTKPKSRKFDEFLRGQELLTTDTSEFKQSTTMTNSEGAGNTFRMGNKRPQSYSSYNTNDIKYKDKFNNNIENKTNNMHFDDKYNEKFNFYKNGKNALENIIKNQKKKGNMTINIENSSASYSKNHMLKNYSDLSSIEGEINSKNNNKK